MLAYNVATLASYIPQAQAAAVVVKGVLVTYQTAQYTLGEDLYAMLTQVIHMLPKDSKFSLTGEAGLLQMYYLLCCYELRRRVNVHEELQLHRSALGTGGVRQLSCPLKLLQDVNYYAPFAELLYTTRPPRQNNREWMDWYISRILFCDGWTTLAIVSESTQLRLNLPNQVDCPAFALIARNDRREVWCMFI